MQIVMKKHTTNGVMLQAFDWYIQNDGNHYHRLMQMIPTLQNLGITSLWLPPCTKPDTTLDDCDSVGYGVYDLWDIGEFNQGGSIRTKYGTKDQLVDLCKRLKNEGINIYMDMVMNHKVGTRSGETEVVLGHRVDPNNHLSEYSDPSWITANTKFDFKERNNTYSDFTWNHHHFTGVNGQSNGDGPGESTIYRLAHTGWAHDVDSENGNFDYVLASDINHWHPEVYFEFVRWGEWLTDLLKLDGYRIDAVKHMSYHFLHQWTQTMRVNAGRTLFAVGEYFTYELNKLITYLSNTHFTQSVFDFPLQLKFIQCAHHEYHDIRDLLDGTITSMHKFHSVSFVDNHDTIRESHLTVPDWFKDHAYAFILLREEAYPSVFWRDLHDIPKLPMLLAVRSDFAYGNQHTNRTSSNMLGWSREGISSDTGLAAIISNSHGGHMTLFVGQHHAGQVWHDLFSNHSITINEDGNGEFYVSDKSISIYLPSQQS